MNIDRPLNILIITFQGDMAGSTNSISYLSKGLADRGHNVFVGIRKESLLWTLLEDTKVSRIPMTFKGKFDKENWRQIRDVVKANDIQVINAQSGIDRYTTIFSKWRYNLNCKIVHTRRQNPLSSGGWLQRMFYIKNTASIIVISEGLKKIMTDKGYPKKHLKVIHNGIPNERFSQWSETGVAKLKDELSIADDEIVIGSVSRPKEQDQIIHALALINNPKIRLVLAGVDKEDYQWAIDKYQLANRVDFLGKVDSSEILNVYRLFDINILASTMDGFGLVLLEAMAMECPVIATNFGGIPDVVQDQENGLLFDNGDVEILQRHINRLLEDDSLREKLIANGKTSAFDTFSMEKTIDNYEEYFLKLIEE